MNVLIKECCFAFQSLFLQKQTLGDVSFGEKMHLRCYVWRRGGTLSRNLTFMNFFFRLYALSGEILPLSTRDMAVNSLVNAIKKSSASKGDSRNYRINAAHHYWNNRIGMVG